MNKFHKISFFIKMVISVMLVLLVLGAANIVQTKSMMNNLFTDQQEKRGLSIANMLSARAANLILVNNFYDLHELAKDTQATNDDVRYVFIVSNQGELLAHSFPTGFPKGLLTANVLEPNQKFKVVELTTEEGAIRDFAVPIFDGRLGVVHIGLSNASLISTLNHMTKQLMLDTFLAVLLSIFFTAVFTRHLFRPIKELVRVTGAITQGDLTQRARVSTGDEFGKLATAFNAMTDYLQKSMHELKVKEEARTHLLQKVISAQEEERKRIARELHDETGQTLASLMMGLKCLAATCPQGDQGCRLDEMRMSVKKTIDAVHRLAVDLRPSILDDMGLIPALEKYVTEFQANFGIDADFHLEWNCLARIPREVEVTVYRIVQEALTNVAKYAEAENVCVILSCNEGGLEVIVEDDGVGFDADALQQEIAVGNQLGLFGMKERAMLVGGSLTIESSVGVGTTVFLRVPLGGTDE